MTTNAAEPLYGTLPILQIGEKTYPLKGLGLPHVFQLLDITATTIGNAARGSLTPQQLGVAILMAAPKAEGPVTAFLGSLIGLTPEEMRDPEVFPIHALPDLIECLIRHPDLMAFVESFTRLLESNAFEEMLNRVGARKTQGSVSSGNSTSSSPVTPG
jgi:hypothetical protein